MPRAQSRARRRHPRGRRHGYGAEPVVAAGRNADFIVLDANPLENIANTRRINKVFLRGQELPRAEMAA
jgi:hypothetical protein